MDCFIVLLSCPNNDMIVGVHPTLPRARALAKATFDNLDEVLGAANDLYGWDAAEVISIDIVTVVAGEPVGIETEYEIEDAADPAAVVLGGSD